MRCTVRAFGFEGFVVIELLLSTSGILAPAPLERLLDTATAGELAELLSKTAVATTNCAWAHIQSRKGTLDNNEDSAKAIYTLVHNLQYAGVPAAVEPYAPEAQHVSLTVPVRWAAPEEHARSFVVTVQNAA